MAAQSTPLPNYQPPQELHELMGGILYSIDQRIVNLADPGGYRFLRVAGTRIPSLIARLLYLTVIS